MISKEWKVDAVLSSCPGTLDVFVAASPHFKKLKNSLLRKALAPRVTVEQAAAIGGVRLDALLASLNEAAGFHGPNGNGSNTPGEELTGMGETEGTNATAAKPDLDEVVLDVRPIIQGGSDPLKTIMKAVRGLGENQSLHLVNSFEPVPLYSVLGGKGFDHAARLIDGEWHIWFFRRAPSAGEQQSGQGPGHEPLSRPGDEEAREEKVVELDVRGLAPPEPMMRILEILGTIGEGTILLVHHHREPMMLYDKLEERGFQAVANRIEEHYYKVVIRKKV
ncbi:MAG: DUF2249 domain-containing protein [Bacteroidota bacterium]